VIAHRRELQGGPLAPRSARAEVRGRLGGVVAEPVLADLELLVSELATNSVRHGGGTEDTALSLELTVAPGKQVGVRWCDSGAGFEGPVRSPREDGRGGWGLVLVDQLASRWGVDRDGRFCVWFELDLAAPSAE
jgi:anti-sigma regulatory factor (Ser/Thr protein kinase)